MTSTEMEATVREYWEDISPMIKGRFDICDPEGEMNWQAAYAYTLEHQEKVRQVEEEIFVLHDRVAFCGNWKDEDGMTVYARILVREQSVLADLLRGVRKGK